ncbi:hypothetical protein M2271_003528 [Streptomyces sp. LBL]|uniref:hypothetical protein n=1 Tax=Streptomyces sp. LBL TaxID=2940562 RepID=UPI00247651A1|nr:hypothetical protein [Streptomyces sp. LBL]MDH6625717.1 hypothetical protein [Streptomyces sp. LBL]
MALTRLDQRYGAAVRSVWTNVLGRTNRSFSSLNSWRDADASRFRRQTLPIILAGERQIAALTASYLEQLYKEVDSGAGRIALDLDAVTGESLRGVDPAEVYDRPFTEIYTALSKGEPLDIAVERGAHRLETIAKTDLQLARTHTVQALGPEFPKFEYTVRELQGEYNCALCLVASTQRYHKRELAPIHPGCDCLVKLVTADEDPGQVIDEEKLDAIHKAVDDALGTHDRSGRAVDYRQIIVSNQHGEIGPVLGFNSHNFTRLGDADHTDSSHVGSSDSPEPAQHIVDEPTVSVSDSTRQQIADVRSGLPTTHEDWLNARSEGVEPASRLIDNRIARVGARINELQKQREQIVAEKEAEFKRSRTPKAKRDELLEDAVWSTDHELQDERSFLDELRKKAATPQDELPLHERYLLDEVPAKVKFAYRTDASGRLLPPEEYGHHLNSLLDVGHALRGDLDNAFQADAELAHLRSVLASVEGADLAAARRAVVQRESALIHTLLSDVRQMGGTVNTQVGTPSGNQLPAPSDWPEQLDEAFRHFPADWLEKMSNDTLHVVGSERAYYSAGNGGWPDLMALSTLKLNYHGAFSGYAAEIAAHELGHRMEQYVPGLKELEYTLIRRRALDNDALPAPKNMADLTAGYNHTDNEMTYEDHWPDPYTGKTYETFQPDDPASQPSEVFQVGLQDLFGRGPYRYGDEELQAFVLAILALL